MRELTLSEVKEVSGGLGPLAIIGVDLALNGIVLAAAAIHLQYHQYNK